MFRQAVIVAALSSVALVQPGIAQSLPQHDIEIHCMAGDASRMINASDTLRRSVVRSCISGEALSYDMLNSMWKLYSAEVKQECIRRQDSAVDPAHRDPTYSALFACIAGGAP